MKSEVILNLAKALLIRRTISVIVYLTWTMLKFRRATGLEINLEVVTVEKRGPLMFIPLDVSCGLISVPAGMVCEQTKVLKRILKLLICVSLQLL